MDTNEAQKQKFSQIIGALVSSIAYARNVADVEALRIAHRYRSNELLKGLPIPRLRFSKVHLNMPVIISGIIPGKAAEANSESVIVEKVISAFSKGFGDVIDRIHTLLKLEHLVETERKLLEQMRRIIEEYSEDVSAQKRVQELFKEEFKLRLEDCLSELDLSKKVTECTTHTDYSIELTVSEAAKESFLQVIRELLFSRIRTLAKQKFDQDTTRQSINEILGHQVLKEWADTIQQSAEKAAIFAPTTPPDLYVSVDTNSIKDTGGGPDSITRISMTLLEEGLEWLTEVQHNGTTASKLIPE